MSLPVEPDCTVAREDREATGLHVTDATPPVEADPVGTIQREPVTSAGASVLPPARNPGLYVPGFVVTGEIARGGMGVVLAAVEADLGREVAIKMLLPGAVGAERATRRFMKRKPHHGPVAASQYPAHSPHRIAAGQPPVSRDEALIRGRTLAAFLTAVNSGVVAFGRRSSTSPPSTHPACFTSSSKSARPSATPTHGGDSPRPQARQCDGRNFGEVQVMDWGIAKSVVQEQETGKRSRRKEACRIQRRRSLSAASQRRG